MLRIEMLPAHHGDGVLVEYGAEDAPHRILIDGGTASSADAVLARLRRIGDPAPLDLAIVTHVDEDHIGGMLALMAARAFHTRDFWFNAYQHLFPPDQMGAAMGEALTSAIQAAGFPHNAAFDGASAVVPLDGPLRPVPLPGGATLTLVSPTWDKLEKLRPKWEAECKKAKIIPGEGVPPDDRLGKHPPPTSIDVAKLLAVPFTQDGSAANGSCIAFLLEVEGKRVLLGADAHPGVVLASLQRYAASPVALDAFKVCHHGSRNNLSVALLEQIACSRFLFSTNGETFGHPDPEAIARVVSRPGAKHLYFNYETAYTRPWNRQALRQSCPYEITFPDDDAGGLAVEI
jgi:beta-lactamase superfamily II metal-dependent hydrolase